MKKNELWMLLILFIFFGLCFGTSSWAEKTISDDLYVAYPKTNEQFALDISYTENQNYMSLITYTAHGRGNQLLGYEYRPEKNGYIIYSNKQTQHVLGSAIGNTVKVTQYSQPINNMTDFQDEFIWDIKSVGSNYYTIANRKTKTYITSTNPTNDTLVSLSNQSNKDNQKFKLRAMNGVYRIRSVAAPNTGWDIENGVAPNRNIISYPLGQNQSNQQWMILFKPNNDGYVITNYQERDLIVNQSGVTGSPKTIRNSVSFDSQYSTRSIFYFSSVGDTSDGKQKVNIYNFPYGDYVFGKDSNNNGVSSLNLQGRSFYDNQYQQWILDKVSDIPKPVIKNLKVSSAIEAPNSSYYVGGNLTLTGDFSGVGFSTFDLYSKFDVNNPVLLQQGSKLNSNGTASFSTTIDTSNYTEGEHFIEVYARADSMFQSNRVANKYNLIYPTPTGVAVPQTINKGTPLKQLNPNDFVKELKDEIGSSVTAEKIENIDTSKLGNQTAKVTIKNRYKSTVVDVPVTIRNVADLSWSNQNKEITKAISVDKSDLGSYLEETLYWKSVYDNQKYQLVIKKENTQIATSQTSALTHENTWGKETIKIPATSLNYGVNNFTIELYNSDGSGEMIDQLSLKVTLAGSLKLTSIPSQLSWTNFTSGQTKGVLSRDKENPMTLSVVDTRNLAENQKNWSLRAKTQVIDSPPFDLIWKDKVTDSGKVLSTEQIVLTKDTATKVNNTYEKTWNETTGVLLNSDTYLKVGNYSGKVIVNWNLYDTINPE